jgi:hypothetical protein
MANDSRKNWGEDSREERHPDPSSAPPAPEAPSAVPLSDDDRIDEESEESFPASDPPSFTPAHLG